MENTNNKKILSVYNNSEVIAGAGYSMTSNYMLPLLTRMKAEKIIKKESSITVIQTILSFKFSKENPFVTQETLAKRLGKSVEYIKKAVSDIKKAGLFTIEKSVVGGLVNAYNFQPLFNLLEKFIIEFKYNNNYDVKIAELMNKEVTIEKSSHDFSWTNNYKKDENKDAEETIEEVSEVNTAIEEPKEEVKEEPKEEEVSIELPEKIKQVIALFKINEEGINIIKKAYNTYKDSIHESIFVEKIQASAGKENFEAYFNTCINNAFVTGEQPKELKTKDQPAKNKAKRTYKPKTIRKEIEPDWINKTEEQKREEEEERAKECAISEREQDQLKYQMYRGLNKTKAERYGLGYDLDLFAFCEFYAYKNTITLEEAIDLFKDNETLYLEKKKYYGIGE